MTNKLNLIFDFNNIAMRALFTCGYSSSEGSVSTFDTDEECNILIRKIATDMAYVMRIFSPDRTIIVCDAKSPWRNKLYEDLDEKYKGNRVKDNTKNWDKIWEALTEYKKTLSSKGFVITELDNAEADDLAALWKQELYDVLKENIILVSSDKDWVQLIDFNNINKNFCLCFNPIADNKKQKKLFINDNFLSWMNDDSESQKVDIFFNNYNPNKDKFKNIKVKDIKICYVVEDPNKVVLEKIFCGDDGDNVPALYSFYKNGKKYRITTSKFKKICEELNISTVTDLCEANDALALKPCIEKNIKKEIDDIDINKVLNRQRLLVELTPDLFPDNIRNSFYFHVKDNTNNGYIQPDNISFSTILQDTKFLEKNYNKPKENKIFDSIKDLEKYIKPIKSSELF